MKNHPVQPSTRQGFTLIEVLIVVAVITILVAIMVAVGASAQRNAQINQTKVVLKSLELISEEYTRQRGGNPYQTDADPQTSRAPEAVLNISDFVSKTIDVPACKQTYSKLPERVFDGTKVYDAWGHEVRIWPRRQIDSGGTAELRPAYFESAGPDGKYGRSFSTPQTPGSTNDTMQRENADNITSRDM